MRTKLLGILAASLTFSAAAGAAASTTPAGERIALPPGWQPEGIAAGKGGQLYVGSIPTGAVLRIDARTGATAPLVPARTGRAAIGLKVDRRQRLFVAGGPTGKAFVYDARTGGDLAEFQLAPAGQPTFVNDVALTREAAYFTDSRRAALYAVTTDLSGSREIALPDIPLAEGNNLNGIVATRDGEALLAVQTNVGLLWRIDPHTGAATMVDLGGATLVNGDGLLLEGRKLYVVQNRLNQIAVVRLDRDLSRGRVVRTITSDDFDVPTTIARLGRSLYAVNARFGTAGPTPATADYWVTRLRGVFRHHGHRGHDHEHGDDKRGHGKRSHKEDHEDAGRDDDHGYHDDRAGDDHDDHGGGDHDDRAGDDHDDHGGDDRAKVR